MAASTVTAPRSEAVRARARSRTKATWWRLRSAIRRENSAWWRASALALLAIFSAPRNSADGRLQRETSARALVAQGVRPAMQAAHGEQKSAASQQSAERDERRNERGEGELHQRQRHGDGDIEQHHDGFAHATGFADQEVAQIRDAAADEQRPRRTGDGGVLAIAQCVDEAQTQGLDLHVAQPVGRGPEQRQTEHQAENDGEAQFHAGGGGLRGRRSP